MWVMNTSTLPPRWASSRPSSAGQRWRLILASWVFFVAERRLDHEVRHLDLGQARPKRGVGPGVAGEDPVAMAVVLAAVDGEADGGHRVLGAQHLDVPPAQLQALADLERVQADHRILGAGQAGEVGPDDAVEDVLAQRVERLRQRVDLDRRALGVGAHAQHGVGQQRDGEHMVQVRVADQDVVDARQGVQRQITDTVPASMSTSSSRRKAVVL